MRARPHPLSTVARASSSAANLSRRLVDLRWKPQGARRARAASAEARVMPASAYITARCHACACVCPRRSCLSSCLSCDSRSVCDHHFLSSTSRFSPPWHSQRTCQVGVAPRAPPDQPTAACRHSACECPRRYPPSATPHAPRAYTTSDPSLDSFMLLRSHLAMTCCKHGPSGGRRSRWPVPEGHRRRRLLTCLYHVHSLARDSSCGWNVDTHTLIRMPPAGGGPPPRGPPGGGGGGGGVSLRLFAPRSPACLGASPPSPEARRTSMRRRLLASRRRRQGRRRRTWPVVCLCVCRASGPHTLTSETGLNVI